MGVGRGFVPAAAPANYCGRQHSSIRYATRKPLLILILILQQYCCSALFIQSNRTSSCRLGGVMYLVSCSHRLGGVLYLVSCSYTVHAQSAILRMWAGINPICQPSKDARMRSSWPRSLPQHFSGRATRYAMNPLPYEYSTVNVDDTPLGRFSKVDCSTTKSSANLERCVFGKLSARCSQRRLFWHTTPLWRYRA